MREEKKRELRGGGGDKKIEKIVRENTEVDSFLKKRIERDIFTNINLPIIQVYSKQSMKRS